MYITKKLIIQTKMQKHTEADEDFAITVEYLLDIASRSYSLFESSGIEQKRKILNLVFPNFLLDGSNLEYTIRRPFNMLLKRSSHTINLGLVDGTRTFYEENIEEFKLLLPLLKELIA